MQAITYSEARQTLAQTMLKTVEDHNPILITRARGESCVLMSLSHYEALEETAYLLRSSANAQRLSESIAQLRNADGVERELLE
ncbi:YoeB-YefM toxin-antitoxin system antitoxin YefM [Pasteurella testudinis]|uniref:YoeB-YefM toxin-antitoxin system antitoxin YefM n=1 Tax=Pasteurella testudinis TaxID=761 RepID=UPI0040581122